MKTPPPPKKENHDVAGLSEICEAQCKPVVYPFLAI